MKQGIEYIPVRLTQKKPKDIGDDISPRRPSKHGGNAWEPSSSDDDHSDSEDSMSDLYPCQCLSHFLHIDFFLLDFNFRYNLVNSKLKCNLKFK